MSCVTFVKVLLRFIALPVGIVGVLIALKAGKPVNQTWLSGLFELQIQLYYKLSTIRLPTSDVDLGLAAFRSGVR
jgi:hypothetical protein